MEYTLAMWEVPRADKIFDEYLKEKQEEKDGNS
jgi:hypothetical protein